MEHIFKNYPFFVIAQANSKCLVTWSTGKTGSTEVPEHRCQLARQKRLASFLSDISNEEDSATPWIITFVIIEEDDDDGFQVRTSFLTSFVKSQAVPTTDLNISAADGREEDGSPGGDDVISGEVSGGSVGETSAGPPATAEKATVRISAQMPHGIHDLGDLDEFDDFFGCYSW